AGVDIQASANLVSQNFIGSNAAGTVAVPNGSGINLFGASNAAINNLVFGNTQNGIDVSNGNGNVISGNQIFSNGGLGISLHGAANNSQAPPVLTSVTSSGG